MSRKTFSRKERLPEKAVLLSLLRYEAETGKLYWLPRDVANTAIRMWNKAHAGKEAFTYLSQDGYLHGRIFNAGARAHRVIWKMVHGEEPFEIDHINGVRTDNRLSNLRAVATPTENKRNSRRRVDNSTGATGVYWEENHQKWRARIRIDGRQLHLGRFADKKDAVRARKEAEREYGFHANHGRDA